MLAVVLAAGRGTRLGPLTAHRSKAMLPVAGQPMIEHVLDMLSEADPERFIVVVHPADHELSSHLRRSSRCDRIDVAYQKQRLGMAHALECAAPLIRETKALAFVLASCDNLYPEGHVANLLHRRREDRFDAALTLMWTPREMATESAVAIIEDSLVADIIEKPDLEDIPRYGQRQDALGVPSLYALSSSVLDYLSQVNRSPRGEREFPDVLRLLIADGWRVGGQQVGHRMTLTKPEDLLALNRHMLRDNPACATVNTKLPPDVTIVPPVRIEEGVTVAAGCSIGPDVYLESGCRIGASATIRRSVVMRNATLEQARVVVDSVITGR